MESVGITTSVVSRGGIVMRSFIRLTPLTVMSDCYGNNLGGTAEVKPFRPNGREGFFYIRCRRNLR